MKAKRSTKNMLQLSLLNYRNKGVKNSCSFFVRAFLNKKGEEGAYVANCPLSHYKLDYANKK
jgi:hypothetical protein